MSCQKTSVEKDISVELDQVHMADIVVHQPWVNSGTPIPQVCRPNARNVVTYPDHAFAAHVPVTPRAHFQSAIWFHRVVKPLGLMH